MSKETTPVISEEADKLHLAGIERTWSAIGFDILEVVERETGETSMSAADVREVVADHVYQYGEKNWSDLSYEQRQALLARSFTDFEHYGI